MKAKLIREMLYACVSLFLLSLMGLQTLSAQAPIYRFQSPTLIEGTDRQVGAKYRFSNVVTGVDAHVRIDSMTSGITLQNIDRTADGYPEAFQPEYRISSGRNAFILFTIQFMQGGTSTPASQANVDLSGLDIDGSTSSGRSLYEMNGVDMGGGVCTFNATNSHIVLAQHGTEYRGWNITGFLFGALVDTSANEVMFTVTHVNVSSFKYRVGANNETTNNSTRYASLYFKRFEFPDGAVLSAPYLRNFQGVSADGKTRLQWQLNEASPAATVAIERSSTSDGDYQTIAEYWVNMEGNTATDFQYTDAAYDNKSVANWYRLRITGVDGKVQYSHVLQFRNQSASDKKQLVLYPTEVQSGVNLQFYAQRSEQASFEIYNLSGKLIYRQALNLQAGQNTIRINTLDGIPRGQFVSTLRTSEGMYPARFSKF